jgi:hypothetical protein
MSIINSMTGMNGASSMRTKKKRQAAVDSELVLAIGLIWGYLNTRQVEDAYDLARGCILVWPDDPRLRLMYAYAAVELLQPLDAQTRATLEQTQCREWAMLVKRREELQARRAAAQA